MTTVELTCNDAVILRKLMPPGISESAPTAMSAAADFAQHAQVVPQKHPLPKHHPLLLMWSMCRYSWLTYTTS